MGKNKLKKSFILFSSELFMKIIENSILNLSEYLTFYLCRDVKIMMTPTKSKYLLKVIIDEIN